MDAKFYERNSGVRLVEKLYGDANSQAEGFQVVLNEYTRFHMAKERLVELQPQLDEQKMKVDELRKELEQAEGNKKQQNQVLALQQQYKNERGALDELARAVNVLHTVKQPEIPSWLVGFLRGVVGERVKG